MSNTASFESKFFADGWNAFKEHNKTGPKANVPTCPYEEDSWAARQWNAGYATASHEYEDETGLSRP